MLIPLPHLNLLAGQLGLTCQVQWHKLKGVGGWHWTVYRGLGVTSLAGPCLQHSPAGIHYLAVLGLLHLVVLDLSRGNCTVKTGKICV